MLLNFLTKYCKRLLKLEKGREEWQNIPILEGKYPWGFHGNIQCIYVKLQCIYSLIINRYIHINTRNFFLYEYIVRKYASTVLFWMRCSLYLYLSWYQKIIFEILNYPKLYR